MCDELCSLYGSFPEKGARIVASGGAVRKNEILKRLIEDTFGMSVLVSQIKEDAAMGAALFCRRG
jgi:ribulose kinase